MYVYNVRMYEVLNIRMYMFGHLIVGYRQPGHLGVVLHELIHRAVFAHPHYFESSVVVVAHVLAAQLLVDGAVELGQQRRELPARGAPAGGEVHGHGVLATFPQHLAGGELLYDELSLSRGCGRVCRVCVP